MFGIIEDGTYRVERIGFSTPTLTTGYVVGVRSITREADIPAEGTLFGRWTAADGTIYWDAVEIIEDLHTALQTAAQRGELAVWDVEAGVEIPVTAAASRVEPEIIVIDAEDIKVGDSFRHRWMVEPRVALGVRRTNDFTGPTVKIETAQGPIRMARTRSVEVTR